ncbi:Protein W02H5.4 [Aphelenchoides avenae]|nr:Protein W02H5.4 [Aphelenchus avenae]
MSDNTNAVPTEKKSRNSYSLEKKLCCIATAKRLNNIDRAAELEGVPRPCLICLHCKKTAAGNPKPPPPELYLEWVLEAWYGGVTKDNVINSFKACGIGAIGGADDHLIHCLEEHNGIPNGLYELTKAREAAEAQELAEILAGFEIEAPDEDDTGHISEVEVTYDEPSAFDDESTGSEEENHNLNDDSEF